MSDRALLLVRALDKFSRGVHVGSVREGSDVLPAPTLPLPQQPIPVVLWLDTFNIWSPTVLQEYQFLRLYRHRHEPTGGSSGGRLQHRSRTPNDVIFPDLAVWNGYLPPRIFAGVSDAFDQPAKHRVHHLLVTFCLLLPSTRLPLFGFRLSVTGRLDCFSELLDLLRCRIFDRWIPSSGFWVVRHPVEAKKELSQLTVSLLRRIVDWYSDLATSAIPTEETGDLAEDPDGKYRGPELIGLLSSGVESDLTTSAASVVEQLREELVFGDERIRRITVLEFDEHLHRLERGDGARGGAFLSLVNGDIGFVFGLCFARWSVGRVGGGEPGEERVDGVGLDDLL